MDEDPEADDFTTSPNLSSISPNFLLHPPCYTTPLPSILSLPATKFEGKREIEKDNLNQLAATCVVSSFVNSKIYQRSWTPSRSPDEQLLNF